MSEDVGYAVCHQVAAKFEKNPSIHQQGKAKATGFNRIMDYSPAFKKNELDLNELIGKDVLEILNEDIKSQMIWSWVCVYLYIHRKRGWKRFYTEVITSRE